MSAETIRTVNIEGKGALTYESDMPMGAIRGLMAGANDEKGVDLGVMIEALSGFVLSWPFKGEPSDPEAWDALKRSEFAAVTKAVVEDFGKLGEE